MPTRHVPLPHVPPNTVLIKTRLVKDQPSFAEEIFSDHWFLADRSLATFNVTTCALDFLTQWIYPVFTNTFTLNNGNLGFWCFANVGTHVQSVTVSPSWAGRLVAGNSIGPQFKVRVLRQGFFGSSYLNGRFGFPSVPLSFVDGNDVSAAGDVQYGSSLIAYMNLVTSQTVNFTAAVNSNTHNVTVPIVNIRRLPLIRFDRKSRIKDTSHKYLYQFPVIP